MQKAFLICCSFLCIVVGSMPTTKQKVARDCIVSSKRQKIKPPLERCLPRTVPLPLCFGLCKTADPLMVNDVNIASAPDCACCKPRTMNTTKILFLCSKGGRKALERVEIRFPASCHCNRCEETGFSSKNSAVHPRGEDVLAAGTWAKEHPYKIAT